MYGDPGLEAELLKTSKGVTSNGLFCTLVLAMDVIEPCRDI